MRSNAFASRCGARFLVYNETIAALQAALNNTGSGGIIVFDVPSDATLRLSQTIIVPYAASYETSPRPIVIDGKGRVTLDGQNSVRIIQKQWRTDLTLQNLRFVNGRVGADPGDGLAEESGAAVNVENWDGRLAVINCTFENRACTEDGPDRGGGAIRAAGQRHVIISNCTFTGCSGSNGGAVFNCTIPGTGSASIVSGCTFENNEVQASPTLTSELQARCTPRGPTPRS